MSVAAGSIAAGRAFHPKLDSIKRTLRSRGCSIRMSRTETSISAGVTWVVGGSGSQRVGANASDIIQPCIFLAKDSAIYLTVWDHRSGHSRSLNQKFL